MRTRTILLIASLAVGSYAPRAAFAQGSVSASDRQLARTLYTKGYEAQQAGRFAEAADSFQRSFDLFNAPTTALHVAECQAALGRLVEASETYRGVSRLQLDPTAPAEFQRAKEQAAAELAQIEPRIPKLTIRVAPAPPNLSVSLDGSVLKNASLGYPRAVNPGVHKAVAVAPGYAQAEQTVEVKERAAATVSLTLQPSAVTYTPVGPGPGPTGPTPGPTGTYDPTARRPQQGGSGFGSEWKQPAPRVYSRMSLLFGATAQVLIPSGDVMPNAPVSDIAGVGGGVGGEVAWRFGRFFLLGVDLEGGVFSNGAKNGGAENVKTLFVGPYLGYISNPDGVGFYGELGGGYRQAWDSSLTLSGGDFLLGLGLHIRAGSHVRLIPKATASMGVFTKGVEPNGNEIAFPSTAPHFLFGFGLAGFFDLDLDKRPAPPALAPSGTTPQDPSQGEK